MSNSIYSEVIWWPFRLWVLFISLDLALIISVGVALTDSQILLFSFLLAILTVILAFKTRLIIDYKDNLLRVGRAKLEKEFMGNVIELSESELKLARNSQSNFLALRFWVKTGIKIEINDKRDPNLNWVISTRNSSAFKQALRS